jgi:NAD(P)-dependent dehydrogenase (short-subunit alcohol dehydrogenase family)
MNILITGANRGLGFELAAEALRRGHRVFACARTPQPGDKLGTLLQQYPDTLSVHAMDVVQEEQVASLAADLSAQGVQLHGVINNAGILLGRENPLEQLNMDDVRQTLEINLYGPMIVVKHMLPLLPTDGSYGAILNISSEAGSLTNAYAGDYPYAISKTALNMFSEQLKRYVEKRNIRVLSVHPGWIRTDMGGDKAPGDPRSSASGILDLAEGAELAKSQFAFVDFTGKPMAI